MKIIPSDFLLIGIFFDSRPICQLWNLYRNSNWCRPKFVHLILDLTELNLALENLLNINEFLMLGNIQHF